MALFSRIHTWVSNEILTASDLNAEFDNILTNAKAASVVGYSANNTEMQTVADPYPGSSESLAASVAEELQRLRYMFKQLSGETQWYYDFDRTLAAGALAVQTADYVAGSVDTAALKDGNVTAGKLGAGSVTQVKRAALGQQLSSSSASFTSSSTSLVDITNLTVTITTTGRPVWIGLVSDGNGTNPSVVEAISSSSEVGLVELVLLEGSTNVASCRVGLQLGSSGATTLTHTAPASVLHHIYAPAAATYTYKIQGKKVLGSSFNVTLCKLLAFEL